MATTTNIALTKPTIDSTGWGGAMNTNLDDLDTLAGAKFLLQTANAKVPNAQILGALSNGLLKVAAVTGVISTAIPGTDYYAAGLSVIPVADGGTGVATVPTNGQLLIGNGTGYTVASLTAGAGITITPGAGTITIADTGSATAGGNPTELQYNSAGSLAGDSAIVRTGAGGLSVTDLAITNDLPITEGGTGASTAAGARTNLGLGTMAVQAASAVAITGGSITGISSLAIADGGTGAASAAGARASLGLGDMAVQTASGVAITGGSITGITDLLVTDGGLNSSTVPLAGQIPIGTGGASYAPAHITAGAGITVTNGASSITIASSSTGHTIQEEGAGLTNRSNLNFVGANVTVTDGGAGPDSTIVTIVGGGSQHVIQEEGVPLAARSALNFVGSQVTVTDGGAGPDSTIVTILPGEVNTASNVGVGTGTIFRGKTGVNLDMKTLIQGANITLTNNANDITIAGVAGGSQHVIQEEGANLPARSNLNFVGSLITVTDGGAGPDSTIVTLTATPSISRSYTYALGGM